MAVGKDFKIAAKDLGFAAGYVWTGIKNCFEDPKCRDTVEKVGIEVVKTALEVAEDVGEAAALQQQQIMIVLV